MKESGLGRSLFERLFRVGGCKVVVLSEQYHMRAQLWAWPNDQLYGNLVRTAESAEQRAPVDGLPWNSPLAFVDVPGREGRDGKSFFFHPEGC